MVEMVGAVTTKAVDDDERAAREAKISVNFMVFILLEWVGSCSTTT